jgi:Zn-dependent M28 family amino/carboxypeptidase
MIGFVTENTRPMRLIHSSQLTASTALSPNVMRAMEAVSESQLRGWVERIAVPRHSLRQSEANQSCANWLKKQFADWGYSAELHGSHRNVVALPKEFSSEEMVVVGAHYDSVPGSPGADDNGSAVAAMLGCAEAMARHAPQTPVCFAAFNGEEDGMVGSNDFVQTFLAQANFKVRAAHILEMVGFASSTPGSQRLPTGLPIQLPERGDFLGLLANKTSGGMMDSVLLDAKVHLPDFPVIGLEVVVGAERVFPVLARSDHVPFWNRNIPAVMWTDTSEFRNPHYHQRTDTPETLDYRFLRQVTQLLVACVANSK